MGVYHSFDFYTSQYETALNKWLDDIFIATPSDTPVGIMLHNIHTLQMFRAAIYVIEKKIRSTSLRDKYFVICDLSKIEDASLTSAAVILDKLGANGFLIHKSILESNPTLIDTIENHSKMPVLEYDAPLIGTQTLEVHYGSLLFITEEATIQPLPGVQTVSLIEMYAPKRREHRNKFSHTMLLASPQHIIKIGSNHEPRIMAENFNSKSHKSLVPLIMNEDIHALVDYCLMLEKKGAHIINLSFGITIEGEFRKKLIALLPKLLHILSIKLKTCLSFDIQDTTILELALKEYSGRALINSVTNNDTLENDKFALARTYGAAIVIMPTSNNVIPTTKEERCTIAKNMLINGRSYNLKDSDFILDGIMLPAKYYQKGTDETLRTLDLYKETFNLPTILGISNLSYEMDNKSQLHQIFLPMALSRNLSISLINVCDDKLMETYKHCLFLLNNIPLKSKK